MTESASQTAQQRVARRLDAMQIKAKLMQGGRAVLATLPLGSDPFEGVGGAQRLESCVFATVGSDRIKCLRPRALFQLPILSIASCQSAGEIENIIREAWRAHQTGLSAAANRLTSLSVAFETSDQGSTLSMPLAGEGSATATWTNRREVALASVGTLAGVTLRRPQDRLYTPPSDLASCVELEMGIVGRMQDLAQLDVRLADTERGRMIEAGVSGEVAPARRKHVVLLVGPKLAVDNTLREKLRLRGYDVERAKTEHEAGHLLAARTPEIVMADFQMGRGDGVSLVLALRKRGGIEELPVILIDDTRHAERRETARRVGAAGYLVRPFDVAKFSEKLRELAGAPRRRRYTRFGRQLSLRIEGADAPALVASISRGGMFMFSDAPLPTASVQRCVLALPEIGQTIHLQAEVLYRQSKVDGNRGGYGMRFDGFEDDGEASLISFLATLEPEGGLEIDA